METDLIQILQKKYFKNNVHLLKGIGDDSAVFNVSDDQQILITTDSLVENVHYIKEEVAYQQIGRKALARSLSDIAAMGGKPKYILVSIIKPNELSVNQINKLYEGMDELIDLYDLNIIGGDLSCGGSLILNVTVIGFCAKDKAILRSNAKPGDGVFVTGCLGSAVEEKHLSFMPRVFEGQFLIDNFIINSMIDISDGLAKDLKHIIRESGYDIEIHEKKIPYSDRNLSNKDPLYHALNDGEDYELLFTSQQLESEFQSGLYNKFQLHCCQIGCVCEKGKELFIITENGQRIKSLDEGYQHF